MGKITGMEERKDVPSKVLLLYRAVEQLMDEGVDFGDIRVSTLTDRAGIGKGTAYEYFDTKEDILVCAVLHNVRRVTEELRHELAEKESFEEKIVCILEQVDKHKERHQYLTRYIHLLTDNSGFCRLIQEKTGEKEMGDFLPGGLFADMLRQGVERGEVRNDLPLDYMIFALFSRLLSYMMCVENGGIDGLEEGRLKQLVCGGLLLELCAKNV